MQSAPEPCAFQLLNCLPSCISQSLTVLSSLEDARSLESPRQLRAVTADLWPASVNSSWALSGSQRLMPPLRSAVASIWPFGLKATAVTQSVCCLILCCSSPVLVEKIFTNLLGEPTATWDWSGRISAVRMESYSLPRIVCCLPVRTSQRTTRPERTPRPPLARRSWPLRLNLTSTGWPSVKGRIPSRSRDSVLKRRICF